MTDISTVLWFLNAGLAAAVAITVFIAIKG